MPEITAKQLIKILKEVLPRDEKEPKAPRLTQEQWVKWGRDLTAADIERFAKSRDGKTSSFETFKALGCRVGPSGNPTLPGDFLAFPHKYTDGDKVLFDYIKLRSLDTKDIQTLHNHSQRGLYNIDTVQFGEDAYVVEGEPDVAVMEEAGFHTVSVNSGSQKKFDDEAIDRLLVADRIFLIGDQAERQGDPGQLCIENLQNLLPIGQAFRIRFTEAHDVCGLAKLCGGGFRKRIEELRDESLRPWVMRNIPTIGDLSQKPVEWVIERMFPFGGLTMVTGFQGHMKSLFAAYAAQAISKNYLTRSRVLSFSNTEFLGYSESDKCEPFLGRKVMAGISVLYLDRENPEAEAARRARGMGIVINKGFRYWGNFCKERPPEIDDPRLLEFAYREKGFIVFDSLQDWYPAGFNENDNAKIMELMGKLQHLAHAGAGVLVLHHFAKYQKVARGGTAFVATTDMAFQCNKPNHSEEHTRDIIELREERFRMCGGWEIDFKAHWNASERHPFMLELLKDDELDEAARKRKEEERAAAESKRVAEETRNQKIEEILAADPTISQNNLAEKLDTTAPTVKRWANKAGWQQKESIWRKAGVGDEAALFE